MVALDEAQNPNKCHYTLEEQVLSCTELKTVSDIGRLIKTGTSVIFIRESPNLLFKRNQYSNPIYSGLKSIQILDSDNVKIEPGAFIGFINITYLKLIKTGLEDIFDNNFEGLSYLEDMNLSNNKIRKLSPKSFNHLGRLTKLDLSSNELQTLPSYIFESLYNLEQLDLTINHIKFVESNALNGLENLKEIYLTNNSLELLNAKEFNRLGNLEVCMLDSNNIKFIKGVINLPKLKFFDIKENQLTQIETKTFEKCSELKSLDLSGNKLKELTEIPFLELKHLKHLNLHNNYVDISKFTVISKAVNIVHN
ncbi:unnamed protein product [Acanthoscelides obtectus]|uniref:Uncharacterized protein n=1 Tax=Acanthoscelides obtectus TaxID=200917 RepID=A0A9P0NYJ8_ACAOB|nr:unnamed protein product [Acanthoscelides obtectus]CAK1623787.1 Leucine-rich repeat-containing protein 15 [Acanthoscelides obtectus]